MGRAKVALFGVPTAAAACGPGVARGPFALRAAGLREALRARGATVVHLSDLSLFPWREDLEHPRARNLPLIACALRAAADEMTRALAEGFAVVLGGDCTLGAAAAAGARRALGQPVGLLWLDANGDLNTEHTSPSGVVDGMALSLALGRGPAELLEALGPAVPAERAALVGYRALDPGERARLDDLGLALPAWAVRTLGPSRVALLVQDALGPGPRVVHFDIDLLDPGVMPAKPSLTPGPGLDRAEGAALLRAVLATREVVGLVVSGYDPGRDEDGTCAALLVELIADAVAARLAAPA